MLYCQAVLFRLVAWHVVRLVAVHTFIVIDKLKIFRLKCPSRFSKGMSSAKRRRNERSVDGGCARKLDIVKPSRSVKTRDPEEHETEAAVPIKSREVGAYNDSTDVDVSESVLARLFCAAV